MNDSRETPWAAPGSNALYGNAEAISLASDYTPTHPIRAIWVGSVGNVKVDMAGGTGTGVVFNSVPNGTFLVPGGMRVSKVYSTANGTSASNLVALW
jgi:hypothetical protein